MREAARKEACSPEKPGGGATGIYSLLAVTKASAATNSRPRSKLTLGTGPTPLTKPNDKPERTTHAAMNVTNSHTLAKKFYRCFSLFFPFCPPLAEERSCHRQDRIPVRRYDMFICHIYIHSSPSRNGCEMLSYRATLIAETDGVAVAPAWLCDGYLRDRYLRPSYQRRGIGSAFHSEIRKHAVP